MQIRGKSACRGKKPMCIAGIRAPRRSGVRWSHTRIPEQITGIPHARAIAWVISAYEYWPGIAPGLARTESLVGALIGPQEEK